MHPLRADILDGRVCPLINTKALHVGEEGPPPEWPHPPDTAVFWCGRTGWAMGPDLLPANPRRCAPGRGCFEGGAEV